MGPLRSPRRNWIQTLKYSPDGKALAVGTHGMVVCLCDVKDGYAVKGTLVSPTSVCEEVGVD